MKFNKYLLLSVLAGSNAAHAMGIDEQTLSAVQGQGALVAVGAAGATIAGAAGAHYLAENTGVIGASKSGWNLVSGTVEDVARGFAVATGAHNLYAVSSRLQPGSFRFCTDCAEAKIATEVEKKLTAQGGLADRLANVISGGELARIQQELTDAQAAHLQAEAARVEQVNLVTIAQGQLDLAREDLEENKVCPDAVSLFGHVLLLLEASGDVSQAAIYHAEKEAETMLKGGDCAPLMASALTRVAKLETGSSNRQKILAALREHRPELFGKDAVASAAAMQAQQALSVAEAAEREAADQLAQERQEAKDAIAKAVREADEAIEAHIEYDTKVAQLEAAQKAAAEAQEGGASAIDG